jgi:hypothetical protein
MCVFYLPVHMRPRVQRAPGLPCALSFFGAKRFAKLGRSVSRECGVVPRTINVVARSTCDEAIQFCSFVALDCFANARNDDVGRGRRTLNRHRPALCNCQNLSSGLLKARHPAASMTVVAGQGRAAERAARILRSRRLQRPIPSMPQKAQPESMLWKRSKGLPPGHDCCVTATLGEDLTLITGSSCPRRFLATPLHEIIFRRTNRPPTRGSVGKSAGETGSRWTPRPTSRGSCRAVM